MRRYLFSKDNLDFENIHTFDVIIVGSGIAGLYCALNISPHLSCAIVTKGEIDEGSSYLAQGGIAAVTKDDDTFENHISDTLIAGAGHCDKKAVEVLIKEGPSDIQKLIEFGVPFDKDQNGEIIVTREGGHNCSRILHCGGDATGNLLTHTLMSKVLEQKNITIFKNTYLLDILCDKNGCTGIVAKQDNKNRIFLSRNIVLATGAIGQIYKYTTNPKGACGDGISAAVRAGAVTKDMEFVQFHPTALAKGQIDGRMFLISEAVRGEGGELKNKNGEPFMFKRHSLGDLAPRDIVTRGILREMEKTDEEMVFLHVSCMSEEFFSKRFPTIYARCKELGINVPHEPIPVRPTQHYHMGGIATDLYARTSVSGLYACGEAACTGVQGANRLASNSTLECLVFGRRAAQKISGDFRKTIGYDFNLDEIKKLQEFDFVPTQKEMQDDLMLIKSTMSKKVGALRTRQKMTEALETLNVLFKKYENAHLDSELAFMLYSSLHTSIIICEKALSRKESLGSHYITE